MSAEHVRGGLLQAVAGLEVLRGLPGKRGGEKARGDREEGEGRREKEEGRREKGGGRMKKGEGRREKEEGEKLDAGKQGEERERG